MGMNSKVGANLLIDQRKIEFSHKCAQALKKPEHSGQKRLLLKGHPALKLDDTLVCLDTINKRLIISSFEARNELEDLLDPAIGHHWPYRKGPFVSYVSLILTTRCSLKCAYCFSSSPSGHDSMAPELARSMAKEVTNITAPNAFPRINFFGGEPTLNLPAIDAVMEELDRHDVDYIPVLMTNGMFNNQTRDFIAERHMLVQFSDDGRANFLRMGPEQEALLDENIQACADLGLPINIRPTVSAHNIEYMTELLEKVHSLAGDQLVTINFGILNVNKGAAKSMSLDPLPNIDRFEVNFASMLQRARELGVSISSIQMNILRSDSANRAFPPCFVTTQGVMAMEALYDLDNPEFRPLVYGRFDPSQQRFVIEQERLELFKRNYESNAFLHDEQNCFAQSLCRGLKKSIKNCREVYQPDHLSFFRQDAECAAMRAMVQVYLLDFLKVMGGDSQLVYEPLDSNGFASADVRRLALEIY